MSTKTKKAMENFIFSIFSAVLYGFLIARIINLSIHVQDCTESGVKTAVKWQVASLVLLIAVSILYRLIESQQATLGLLFTIGATWYFIEVFFKITNNSIEDDLMLYDYKINGRYGSKSYQNPIGSMGNAYFNSGWKSKFEHLDPRNKHINPLKITHRFEGHAINYDGWKQKFKHQDHKTYVAQKLQELYGFW